MKDSLDLSTVSQTLAEGKDTKQFCTNEVQIRNQPYIISLTIHHGKQVQMDLEVESKLSADQWKSTFDIAAIETMTAKTGNFKSFNVFVNMLENAINQESTSVSIDLFTYDDLESLRRKRQGQINSINSNPNNVQLANKRYLILTYNAEFDRIYYPLSLPYCGKPSPVDLMEQIRLLKSENKILKSRIESDPDRNELIRLQIELGRIKKENNELRQEMSKIRCSTSSENQQQIEILRQMVRSSEENLDKERAQFQRLSSKKSDDCASLHDQIESLRISERQLKSKVRTLTNEIGILKKNVIVRPSIVRSTSKERLNNVNGFSPRSSRQEKLTRSSLSRPSSGENRGRTRLDHILPTVSSRNRSASNDSRRSENQVRQRSLNRTKRSPSPQDSRHRFNPTEYVREKNKKLRQIESERTRRRSSSRRGSDSDLSDFSLRTRRTNTLVSNSKSNESDDGSKRRIHHRTSSRKRSELVREQQYKDSTDSEIDGINSPILLKRSSSSNTTNINQNKVHLSSSDHDQQNKKSSRLEVEELVDIDQRLKSLEKFMKETLPS